ncbi:MAG: hypothetical protein JNL82_40670 [Myxococcales bacterium]|nr:hypothetical protein [Myxococcales bacterium]
MPPRAPALLFLLACTPPAPQRDPSPADARVKQPPARPVAAPDAAPSALELAMTEHYRDTLQIKAAVIDGELQDTRAPARRLLRADDAVPGTWRPFVAANADHAAALLAARDRHAAAAAAAGLARTCGDCHAAHGVGPAFEPPHDTPASAPHAVHGHMQRHQWAADRMWEALIDRSEYAWMAGAAALVDAPLARADLTQDVELPDDVAALAAEVHALGARAGASVGWSARAGLYGELLATCAGCHRGGC